MAQTSNVPSGKGLKIIGAGFGRTGTASLKAALETLGFGPCYHMDEVVQNAEMMIPLWEAVLDGTLTDWNSIFANYQATVDWPACNYYAELMKAYPEAKVLLSVRDPDSWYQSAFNSVYQAERLIGERMREAGEGFVPDARMMATIGRFGSLVGRMVWQRTFHGRFAEKDDALSVFTEHSEEVKRNVPAEKLLVFYVKEGWEPLCAFLGVAVPNTPFPHLNEGTAFAQQAVMGFR